VAALRLRPLLRYVGADDATPSFGNQVATLELEGRRAIMRLEKAVGAASAPPQLEYVMEERLA
jgi:hypothetical protein